METSSSNDPRRDLASVSVLLEHERVKALLAVHPRPPVLDAIRDTLDAYRTELKPGDSAPDADAIAARIGAHFADRELDRLRGVINATGILLHTGLGRAVLPQEAVDALAQLNGCCNLQIDLDTGLRGKRNYMTELLEQHMPKRPDISWTKPEGGLFLWIRLPEGIDTDKMLLKAIERKVAYVGGSSFYFDEPEHNTMRINFSYSSLEQIEEGVKRLARVVEEELAGR